MLHPGQQASYWIHLDKRQPVALLVAGRTAGEIALWRNGEWREEDSPRHAQENVRPGQPIHRWVVDQVLEAGDYLLTAYGADAAAWSQGKSEDELEVAFGFPQGGPERTAELTLPASGQGYLELPEGPSILSLGLDSPPAMPVSAAFYTSSNEGQSLLGGNPEATCAVQAKQLIPTCAIPSSAKGRHVVEVKGPPGTVVELTLGAVRRGRPHRRRLRPGRPDGHLRRPALGPVLRRHPGSPGGSGRRARLLPAGAPAPRQDGGDGGG